MRTGPDFAASVATQMTPSGVERDREAAEVAVLALRGDERDVLVRLVLERSTGTEPTGPGEFGNRDERVAGVGQQVVGAAGDHDVEF